MTHTIGTILAQRGGGGMASIFGWSFVLVVLVLGLFVVVWWARRRAVELRDGATGGSQPFSLSELRTMRDGGQITQEQYEKLRGAIVGPLKSGANHVGDAKPPG